MDNDFLDVGEAQVADGWTLTGRLRRLVAYSVINVLEVYPGKEPQAPVLVIYDERVDDYRMAADLRDHTTVEGVLEGARVQLEGEPDVGAYALVLDSREGLAGFPEERPLDDAGRECLDEQPVIAVYLGEKGDLDGSLVIQPYVRRLFKGGATPLGAPLLVPGPASLIQ